MRKIIIICMALLSSVNLKANNPEKEIKSSISKVTVYLQGAQVNRNGNFYAKAGTSDIILTGVSPYLDANSLQARGIGDFTIMDVRYEVHYPDPQKEIKNSGDEMPLAIKKQRASLLDSIADISFEIERVQSLKEVLTLERNMLLNNGTVKGTGKVNDSIPLLKDAMKFFHEKMTEINMELLKYKKKEQQLVKERQGIQTRLNHVENWRNHNNIKIETPKGPEYRVVVTINSDKAVQGSVNIAYIVSQAGWVPSYDLKADKFNAPVELAYKAEIYQNTGNDWEQIPVTLSTANPYSRQQKPELSPWYISYYNQTYIQDKKDSYSRERTESLAAPTLEDNAITGAVGGYQKDLNQKARSTVDYTTAVENMVMAEYEINLPYNIKSNNKKYMVSIDEKKLKADYHLALVPKLDQSAFLVANVTDWEDLNLIPAKARIYYDGTFVGQSYIDPLAMQDTLKLAMGRDNSVSAIRKKLKDKTKEKVIGDNKVQERYFEIIVKNRHGYGVDIVLEDQVPVSNNQEIKVEVLEKNKADLNEFTGILTWRFKLRSGGSEEMNFGYSVKYDKHKNVSMY